MFAVQKSRIDSHPIVAGLLAVAIFGVFLAAVFNPRVLHDLERRGLRHFDRGDISAAVFQSHR